MRQTKQTAAALAVIAVPATGADRAPMAVFDVPEGFNGGGGVIWTNKGLIAYWTVSGVHEDPCSAVGEAPAAGTTVEDLATALAEQKITTTTGPVEVSIDGHKGLYLELATPADFDFGSCNEDALLNVWEASPGDDGRWMGESTVERLWILDVDGQRVKLSNGLPPEATDATADHFSGIVTAATFVEAG